ncbi:DEAD/DEAH box helicase [Paenibacillus rhizophilus]|uniref:DEAD/DEAH box helicase n=2 Tax=Paenibacillus rhizophilus TaxID=1850366 RepID=A0A3N9P405_9BACL|nr:DEAD/DEAH box helicase [Paenibacillus rhizophilus]RQW10883.1 DEAD/DEAH box helicase [Paenibacillus rhizophilus]
MNGRLRNIAVRISLSEFGDALLYGLTENGDDLPGMALKQLLFAWHQESWYGTELAIHKAGEIELVVLPAEQVLPFFAAGRLLTHIGWSWEGEAAPLALLAPCLSFCLENKRYEPSLAAYREGRLEWAWDEKALRTAAEAADREAGAGRELEKALPYSAAAKTGSDRIGSGSRPEDNPNAQGALARLKEDEDLMRGVRAAFSAAVFGRHYSTEELAADLRREYPMLFERSRLAAAGMDAEAWLVSIGWKADVLPFRPALQLLEPNKAEAAWRLRLVLQDKTDAASLVPVKLAADGAAHGAWPASWSPHVQGRSAGWLERLRACLPAERFGSGDDLLGRPLDSAAAWTFLTADSRRLLDAGWLVLLPAWWEAASRRKPRLRAKLSPESENRSGRSLFGLDAIIDFDWRISIGDADLTEEEFAALVARGERLVRFHGQWIPLDPVLLAQIRRAMDGIDKRRGLSFQDVLQLHLLNTQEEAGDQAADEAAALPSEETNRLQLEVELNEQFVKLVGQLGGREAWPQPGPPASLNAELRPYQLEGYSWLVFLRRFGLGACLADDMGLGKTVQLISYLLRVKEDFMDRPEGPRPSLIICPTSVLGNWQKELNRFAPSLSVMLHYGSGRLGGEGFHAAAGGSDIVLTSYATAALDQELLAGCTWSALCLDEAQNIKNAQTKQSLAVRSFPALHRIALTGTPIENRLAELWSIYDFITPGFLGPLRAFQERFINPIEKEGDAKRTADLRQLVKPFMLRRKKKDPAIQLDLPDKNEMKTYVHLTAEQAALYDQTVNELMSKMNKLEGIQRKGAILAALTRLKQLCDHPLLITKEAAPNEETSYAEPIDTGLLIERSAKLERLLAMVKELRDEGERCLIFTQYVGMGLMLQRVLREELHEPVLYLNGSTSKSARDRMIEDFQAGREALVIPGGTSAASSPEKRQQPCIFILSLKAGGVGLNLTAANHVFHFDRWWNPAVENQATDRAYRMGQTRDVQVHKFISLGTLEERIDEMLETKQQLSDSIITSSEGWITELSTDALKDLFALRRGWSDA